jgi:hypothetical protein
MKDSHIIHLSSNGKERAAIAYTTGNTYRVDPTNPQKKKHRDRVCTILEFDDDFMPQNASVRFHDNNRIGKVDLSDLVPVDQVVEGE